MSVVYIAYLNIMSRQQSIDYLSYKDSTDLHSQVLHKKHTHVYLCFPSISFHGKCFPSPCLTVGKDCAIEAFQYFIDNGDYRLIVKVLLLCLRTKHLKQWKFFMNSQEYYRYNKKILFIIGSF